MQCYTELTPPTAVTHVESLALIGPKCHNLVVAKYSQLQIFELKAVTTKGSSNADQPSKRALKGIADTSFPSDDITVRRLEHTSKLNHIAEYMLHGTITSLKRIKLIDTTSGGDALLISTKDAKASLVEWDPESFALRTISVHFYEGDELRRSPWCPDLSHCQSYLTVDPSSRCAALKFGERSLAIIPFRQPGDDIGESEYDSDAIEDDKTKSKEGLGLNGHDEVTQSPYGSSFVLPLTALDPKIMHLVDISFLYEFREPTFGIISSSIAPSASLLRDRKDPLTYAVFTLDLDQRASTTLLSISGLPYDIFRIISLPAPVGGSLLLGFNEIIHVDQAGKTIGVAVNEFALLCSNFPLNDRCELNLKLEGCVVEQLETGNGDLLLVISTGQLFVISFQLDGRTVSAFNIHKVAEDCGGMVFSGSASCATSLGRGKVFIGSEFSDSILIGFTQRSAQINRKRSRADMLRELGDISADEDDFEDFDDDIYSTDQLTNGVSRQASTEPQLPSSYYFRVHDTLENLAPLQNIAIIAPSATGTDENNDQSHEDAKGLHLIGSCGKSTACRLLGVNQSFNPTFVYQFSVAGAQAIWSVHAKKPIPNDVPKMEPSDNSEAATAANLNYDQLLFVSRTSEASHEESIVYDVLPDNIKEKLDTEFESEAGATIDVGTLNGDTRIVQILKSEIRSYDLDLRLAQILPINEEESDVASKVKSASFADPYLLILRDDGSALILEADANGDIDELEQSEAFTSLKWKSGCIYKSHEKNKKIILNLLAETGTIKFFEIPNIGIPIFSAEGIQHLPPLFSAGSNPRRGPKANIVHVTLATLGDDISQEPYLFIYCANGDLILYKSCHNSAKELSHTFSDNQWLKTITSVAHNQDEYSPLVNGKVEPRVEIKAVQVNKYFSVFVGGEYPRLVVKSASSLPIVLDMSHLGITSMTSFHTLRCERGFMYLTQKDNLHVCRLPSEITYSSTGWTIERAKIGHDICGMCTIPGKDLVVLGTSEEVSFALPEDDYHWEWNKEDIALKPVSDRGLVELYHSATRTIIDVYRLNYSEVILSMKTLYLEVSEITHERRHLIAVGTAILQGEDLPSKGNIYIFDVILVVPQPGRPETNQRLKLIVKEEVKGAVTDISEIGSQGFLIAAQGQKCMVRGLKEDETLLPVAFMDMQCYVSVVKELSGTGMLLLGDVAKGSWFVGYTEEPYKMTIFGKAKSPQEILNAEFLPFDKQLFIILADADCNIHVLQYDPEHPKSLSGQRLLHKSAFHTGHFPSTMSLLLPSSDGNVNSDVNDPMNEDYEQRPRSLQQVLMTMQSGAISLITPLEEQMYRRLIALQTYLGNILEHPLGLNPRAFRAVEGDGYASRGVVDGNLVLKWHGLGTQRKAEACAKAGSEDWLIRSDLEHVSGTILGQ